jgi:hypothetical protein
VDVAVDAAPAVAAGGAASSTEVGLRAAPPLISAGRTREACHCQASTAL